MKLYLLRHGKADVPNWHGPDDERPLTEDGVQEMRLVGAALRQLRIAPDVIVTSPLPRALRTAEIAAKALGVALEVSDVLRPGFDRPACNGLLSARRDADVMLVGHEPDFSDLIHSLTGGWVKLQKAATAAVEIGGDSPAPRLLWLFPAKTLLRLSH